MHNLPWFVIGIFFLTQNSFAFTLIDSIEVSYNHNPKIYVNNVQCAEFRKDFTNNGQASSILDLAVESVNHYWNSVVESKLKIEKGGLIQDEDLSTLDIFSDSDIENVTYPDIVITCNGNSNAFSGSGQYTLAFTRNVSSGTEINRSVIVLNDYPGTPLNDLDRNDFMAVLAHEIGHAIGFGHSQFEYTLMYFQDVRIHKKLSEDDIDAITYLYPKKDFFMNLSGCGTIKLDSQNPKNEDKQKWMSFFLGVMLMLFFGSTLFRKGIKNAGSL